MNSKISQDFKMISIPGNSVVREFEYKISTYTGAKHCISTCNATVGIMGVFYALGLSGKEIITTPLTWPGSLSGPMMLNCKLKFCDVKPVNLTINPELIEPLITENTKAVFSADFLGYPARLDEIKDICTKHNLMLIHDAASSFSSKYKGFHSGHFADVTIMSFGSNKIFSIGEGGCILTNDKKIYDQIAIYMMHPIRQNSELNDCNQFALNTNLNPIAAEYGLEVFDERIKEIVGRKEKINELLKHYGFNNIEEDSEPNFFKILITGNQAAKIKNKKALKNLPFESLVLCIRDFESEYIYRADCPVAENVINNYRILESNQINIS